jgi:PAS domain S-box-containing protein
MSTSLVHPAPTAPLPAPTRRHLKAWLLSLLLLLALPLAWHLSPQYEASGAMVAPLAPGLALAFAATALLGWRVLPAVLLGGLIGAAGWPLGEPSGTALLKVLTLLAQAAFGGMLMRRSSRPDDLALDSPPAVRRFVAAAIAAGLIGGFVELVAELLGFGAGALRPGLVALVRATADGASVLLLAPLVFAFASPQRGRWLARRRSVVLPLVLLSLVLLAALAGIDARDRMHAQQRFDRDTEVVFARTQALLEAPLNAVQAINGALRAAPPSPASFDPLARPWLARTAGLSWIGWLDATRTPGGAGASAAVRHVLARGAAAGGAPGSEAEAMAAAAAQQGTLSRALGQEAAVVSPPVTLADTGSRPVAVVVYQAVPGDAAAAQRQAVFATVMVDPLMAPLAALRNDALRVCLLDINDRAQPQRLYGGSGCDAANGAGAPGAASAADDRAGQFSHEVQFDFAGRRWALQVSQPVRTPGGVWLFALPALAGCGLLAVLLLGMTGRAQRAEADARHRTDGLRHELEQLRHAQQRGEQALAGAFEAAQTGLAIVEHDGRVQRANTAFAALLGSTPADIARHNIDELLVDDEHPGQPPVTTLLHDAGDELAHRSMRLRLAGGRVLPALVTMRALREPDGRTTAAVCALHDLSDNLRRRHAERVLGEVLDLSHNPPAQPPQRAPRTTQAQRILAIHRDEVHAALPRAALAERQHVQLTVADSSLHDAAALKAQVQANAPHLLVLDAELSGHDGLALLRALQADAATRAIPVIVLSEDPRPDRIDAAFSAGARAYLTRPVEARQLLAAIDELI